MSEWVKKLKKALEEAGVSFEAEETVRIHLGDLVVEVGEAEKGPTVTVSLQLPGAPPSAEEVESYTKTYQLALKLVSRLTGELGYELDTSLPGYPLLHIVVAYTDADKMAEEIIAAVKELAPEAGTQEKAGEEVIEG